MFETMAQFVLSDHLAGRSFEPPIGPAGYARLLSQRRRPYATLDGHLCVLIYSDRQWNSFFHLIGRADELLADPRFATIGARTRHIGELYALVGEVMAQRSSAEWTALFEAADIAVMPLHTLDSLIDDPHLRAVGFFEEVEHPSEGRLRTMRVASTWSDSPPVVTRQAPRLGEHSAELLAEAGYAADEIARMARAGVTRLAPAHTASSVVPIPL
ncbi:MAG: CoA transferase, partial [Comamonadaceae bacterium]